MFGRRKRHPHKPSSGSPANVPQEGDGAFADLYARFAPRVHAYALQRLHDPDLAADITSTTFMRALAALPDFKLPTTDSTYDRSIEGWLLTIARNAIIDHVRANQRLIALDIQTFRDHLADHTQDPANAAIASDERHQLLDALDQLNVTQRRIVLLRLQGWNGVEIAELLGMSHGSVRVAQYRAYGRLRELLTPESAPSEDFVAETHHA